MLFSRLQCMSIQLVSDGICNFDKENSIQILRGFSRLQNTAFIPHYTSFKKTGIIGPSVPQRFNWVPKCSVFIDFTVQILFSCYNPNRGLSRAAFLAVVLQKNRAHTYNCSILAGTYTSILVNMLNEM